MHARDPEELQLMARQKKDLSEVDSPLWTSVSAWLRRHGKNVKPKLEPERLNQLRECFRLMDQDGSGAIDVEELGAALKLLGIRMKASEVQELVDEVDFDGTGELEMDEFLSIMTTTMQRVAEEGQTKNGTGNQVPFGLVATAYRRKRLMEGIMSSDRSIHRTIQQMNEQHAHEVLAAQAREAELEQLQRPSGTPAKLKASVFGRDRIQRLNELKFDEALIASFAPSEQQVIMKVLGAKGSFERTTSPVRAGSRGGSVAEPIRRQHTTESWRSSSPAPASRRPSIYTSADAGAGDQQPSTSYGGSPAASPNKAVRSSSVGRTPSRAGRYGPSITHHVLMHDTAQTFDLKFNRPLVKLPQHLTHSRCASPAMGSNPASPRGSPRVAPALTAGAGAGARQASSSVQRDGPPALTLDGLQIQRQLSPSPVAGQSSVMSAADQAAGGSMLLTLASPDPAAASAHGSEVGGRSSLLLPGIASASHGHSLMPAVSSSPSSSSLPPVTVHKLPSRRS